MTEIFGTTGNDLIIGYPNPAYIVDALDGYDTISFSDAPNAVTINLAQSSASLRGILNSFFYIQHFEAAIGSKFNDSITGNADDNLFTGGSGADTLIGGSGADTLYGEDGDDRLTGGIGFDVLIGGVGNDNYFIEDEQDVVIELAGEGNDTVSADFTYTLLDNFENLVLRGNAAINGYGNDAANRIQGGSGNNFLFGGLGSDSLAGGAGADSLDGGEDSDRLDGGADNDYLFGGLGAGADTLLGGGGADSLDGGDGADSLNGGTENDLILGGAGNDTLEGDAGDDILFGEAGADIFVYRTGDGADRINDFTVGVDRIRVSGTGVTSFSQLQALLEQDGTDAGIVFDATNKIVLQGVNIATLTAADFLFG